MDNYLKEIDKILRALGRHPRLPNKSRLPTVERLALSAIDNCLTGDYEALQKLLQVVSDSRNARIGFIISTGRSLESAQKELKRWNIPLPDALITAVGSEIYYTHNGRHIIADHTWEKHIDYRWEPKAIRKLMQKVPGMRLRAKSEQNPHRISYILNPDKAPAETEIKRMLRNSDLHANVIVSERIYMDIVPIRASKGLALRYLALKWGIPLEHCFVAGDSGNDAGMLIGETLGTVVANHSRELDKLRGKHNIYFAETAYARGIIEGINYYHFLDKKIPLPQDQEGDYDEVSDGSSQLFASGK